MKRKLSFMMAVLMIISLIPIGALTSYSYNDNAGANNVIPSEENNLSQTDNSDSLVSDFVYYPIGQYMVTVPSLDIYESAAESSQIIGNLAESEIIKVTKSDGTWGKVTVNSVTGWILLESCTQVNLVTYDANGGIGVPEQTFVAINKSINVPNFTPTRAGMVFRGWAVSADNADKGIVAYSYNSVFGGSSQITPKGNLKLYACWAYKVTLNCGREGWGSGSYVLYKYPGTDLSLECDKYNILVKYGFRPGATGVTNDQRLLMEWNTAQNANGKGIGTSYRDKYTDNKSATLNAVWGYSIQYNADGGTFPKNGSDIFLTYVCGYDGVNYQNPKTLYGNFDFPEGDNLPTKEGCRLKRLSNGKVFYLLLRNNGTIFTSETADNNLTIPPVTSSGLNWSHFHTTLDRNGNRAVEFFAP